MDTLQLTFVSLLTLTTGLLLWAVLTSADSDNDLGLTLDRSRRLTLIGEWRGISPRLAFGLYLAAQFLLPAILAFWRKPFAIFVFLLVAVGFATAHRTLPPLLARRRLKAFEEQLPHVLDQLVSAVRGNRPLAQALEQVAPTLDPPAREEIGELASKAAMTAGGMREAVAEAREKYDSRHYAIILSLLHVFSQRGGNLVEPMQQMSSVFKEVWRLEQKIETAAAAARSSFHVINFGLLAIVVMVSFAKPEMLDDTFRSLMGIALFVAGLAIYGIGLFFMRAMMRIEI